MSAVVPIGGEQTSVDPGMDGIDVPSSLATHKLTSRSLEPNMTQVAGPYFALLFGKRDFTLLGTMDFSIKVRERSLRADRAEVSPLALSPGPTRPKVLETHKALLLALEFTSLGTSFGNESTKRSGLLGWTPF